MYLNILKDFELIGNLSKEMLITNKCGELFIEILNNYSTITTQLYNLQRLILERSISPKYLHIDIPITKEQYNLNFIIYIMNKEFKDNYDTFYIEKEEYTKSLNYLLENERSHYRRCRKEYSK